MREDWVRGPISNDRPAKVAQVRFQSFVEFGFKDVSSNHCKNVGAEGRGLGSINWSVYRASKALADTNSCRESCTAVERSMLHAFDACQPSSAHKKKASNKDDAVKATSFTI
jgi:hypothetical protein